VEVEVGMNSEVTTRQADVHPSPDVGRVGLEVVDSCQDREKSAGMFGVEVPQRRGCHLGEPVRVVHGPFEDLIGMVVTEPIVEVRRLELGRDLVGEARDEKIVDHDMGKWLGNFVPSVQAVGIVDPVDHADSK
jgi:hypothetical protein